MTTLEEALALYLVNQPALSALVGSRVYPLEVPQDATRPAIRYQVISSPRSATHGGPAGGRTRVQLTVHAATYGSAVAVADVLVGLLHARRNTPVPGASFVSNVMDLAPLEGQEWLRAVDVMFEGEG